MKLLILVQVLWKPLRSSFAWRSRHFKINFNFKLRFRTCEQDISRTDHIYDRISIADLTFGRISSTDLTYGRSLNLQFSKEMHDLPSRPDNADRLHLWAAETTTEGSHPWSAAAHPPDVQNVQRTTVERAKDWYPTLWPTSPLVRHPSTRCPKRAAHDWYLDHRVVPCPSTPFSSKSTAGPKRVALRGTREPWPKFCRVLGTSL